MLAYFLYRLLRRYKLMKKFISLFTTLCIVFGVLGTFTVFAEDGGTYKDTMTWTLDDNGVLTISGTGVVARDPYDETPLPWDESRSSITQVVLGEGITGVEGEWTFMDMPNLESVTFPESITVIGYESFATCPKLTSVTIPKNVKEIGERAFGYCDNLVSINVAEDNQYYSSDDGILYNKDKTELIQYPIGKGDTSYTIPENVTSIGGNAFMYDNTLTSVVIPETVKSIGYNAFYFCENLADIIIGNGVEEVGGYAFDNTAYYNDETKWEDDVLYIGNYLIGAKEEITGAYEVKNGTKLIVEDAFSGCRNLTGVTIPNSVKTIGAYAFMNCYDLSELVLPKGLERIYDDTFAYCTSLTNITLPDSIISIGDSAFNMCTKLADVEIPSSVTTIGDSAFSSCALTSLTIPAGVVSIGSSAFPAYSLTEINVDENNTNYMSDNGVLFNKEKTQLMCYPGKKAETSYAVPNGVITICDSAFQSGKNLTEITVPDSVKSIGHHAFSYCIALTGFTIPDSVTALGSSAFSDCQNLAAVTIGKGVKSIEYETFYDCYALIDITIPDGVMSIGECAFRYCKNLEAVTIGSGVTEIGDNAFGMCNKLKDIYYHGSQEDFEKISIGIYNNEQIKNAEKHYILPPVHTHTLVHHAAVAATCTEMGNREYWQCSGCGNVFEDEDATREIDGIPTIDAKGHTEVTDTAVEPTCETDGKTAGSHCSVCNTVITEQTIIPKLNHNWGAWSITTEPTFDVTGKAARICENDNTHKEIVDLPILTDTKIWTEGLKIEPTETEKGAVTYTSQYGNVTIIIPALNPEYDYVIKYENEKAIVTVPKDDTYTVIFASYDNGRLLSVNAQDIQLVKGENPPISPQNFNANGKVKVMLWDSLKGMKPLCAADGN
jgi:hypothetical protein